MNFGTRLLRKIPDHLRLLRHDPERFGRNLMQKTNPALFEERLLDLIVTPPMHVAPAGPGEPRLNLLDTHWGQRGMTGGPNTALNLAARVAMAGVKLRLVSTVTPASLDRHWLARHLAALLGTAAPDVEIASAGDLAAPLPVTDGDVFLATHWRTAQQLKPVLAQRTTKSFFYLFQEFEAGFYAWSSNFAQAIETLDADFWPIVNEAFLADYLLGLPFGRLASDETRRRAMVFEPAVDRAIFHARRELGDRPSTLIFYARPTNSRNLFGLGLTALRQAVASGLFDGWNFVSIGSRDSVSDLALGNGRSLARAPWMDYASYPDLLRSADILLCPMLSPHTSYPVLEMAACGGTAVTNTFLAKTKQALAGLSDDIVAVPPSVDGFVAGLRDAAGRVAAGPARSGLRGLPLTWGEALDPIAQRMARLCRSGFAEP